MSESQIQILVLDDEEIVGKRLKTALEKSDYDVEKRPYRGGANSMGIRRFGSGTSRPNAWFVKLRSGPTE